MNTTRYLAIGGYVTSQDGDRHYIGPTKLCHLYGIKRQQAILVDGREAQRLRGLRLEDFTILEPRQDGNYKLP